MALPRVMAPLSRSIASWSSKVGPCWSLLIEAKTYPPYTLFPFQRVIRIGRKDGLLQKAESPRRMLKPKFVERR
jgi:hypothetical protein